MRLTPAERALIVAAAERAGDTLSEYVRESMIVTAREELGMDPTRRRSDGAQDE